MTISEAKIVASYKSFMDAYMKNRKENTLLLKAVFYFGKSKGFNDSAKSQDSLIEAVDNTVKIENLNPLMVKGGNGIFFWEIKPIINQESEAFFVFCGNEKFYIESFYNNVANNFSGNYCKKILVYPASI